MCDWLGNFRPISQREEDCRERFKELINHSRNVYENVERRNLYTHYLSTTIQKIFSHRRKSMPYREVTLEELA